ncbi:MAG: choice-of-anchor Q domain-containing protein, partial [bacterium]
HMWLGPLSDYANDNVIENNVMLDTGADEGRNFAAMGILGYRNIIRHNSVWNTGVFHAIGLFDGGDNIVVNNAVSASQVTIWVLSGAVEDGGNLVQYNDLYSWRNEEKFGWGNVLYDSLADWEAVSGQTNNIDSDPLFVDPDNDNLKLQQGSECIDGGTDVNGSDEDYEGNPRPEGNGYDIGAFEYKESGVEDKKGDINGDGQVDVLDVVRAVNIILEIDLPPTEYELWAADCNGDEEVNVLDVVGIVNVILGTGSCTP